MDQALRDFVRQRAADKCEYCLLEQRHSELRHHVEHVIARKHGGSDAPENLALACHRCNLHKGPNLAGVDPVTSEVARLFHPRVDPWDAHFRRAGGRIEGLTPTGRATVRVLGMNTARRVELRDEIEDAG